MSYQPWGQPGQQGGYGGPPGQAGPHLPQPSQAAHQASQLPMMRASHADRERTVDVLKAGYAEGRLSLAEYEQRMGRAHQAQTYGELHALIVDLPQGPMAVPAPAPQYAQPYQPAVPRTFLPPPPQTNNSAVGALVCGVLTPFYGVTAIPAVILGHKARAEIRRTGEKGDGMAMAGLVLGWLTIGFAALVLLAIVVIAAASP
ncbi:DUF1707 and DUF4190 domain-containing protein [Streptomyces radiopugnans]|uniref:DUF1707 and DUF4190 domain-containing protein n=1 Tax=Streptomyces radiopugnans TaxID=403935 RepID=UPI003F1C7C81